MILVPRLDFGDSQQHKTGSDRAFFNYYETQKRRQ